MKKYAGRCKCGAVLDMRIADVREKKYSPVNERVGWLIFGICEDCGKMFLHGFHKLKIEPTEYIDYVVDYDRLIKRSKKGSMVSFLKKAGVIA